MNQQNTGIARRQETALAARPDDEIWSGKLQPHEKAAVNRIANEFGLSPFLGHVSVLGGKLYIGIEGWLEIANRHPKYDGYDLRVLTREEKDAMLAGPDDVMFEARVYRKDRRRPAVAYGRANKLNTNATHQGSGQKLVQEVAQARALRKALRAAFSATELPLPDAGDGEERAPEEPETPERDYQPFWQAVKALGVTGEQAHEILDVESVKEVADLREAYRKINAWLQEQQLAKSGEISGMEMLSGAYALGYQDQHEVLEALGVKSFGAWKRQGKTWSEALATLQAAVAARPIARVEPPADDEADWQEVEADAAAAEHEPPDAAGADGEADQAAPDAAIGHPAGSIEAAWQRYNAARASALLWNTNNPSAQVKIAPPPPEREATVAQVNAYAKNLEDQVAKALQPFAAGGK